MMMNIFRNIGNAMARFMYGRNGMDQLNIAGIMVSLILSVAQTPAASYSSLFGHILYGASMAIWVIVIFRCYSKNLQKRRSENRAMMGWWVNVRRKGKDARVRRKDKDHKYFTCPQCKTICRVPLGKGKVVITCPKCKHKISAKT